MKITAAPSPTAEQLPRRAKVNKTRLVLVVILSVTIIVAGLLARMLMIQFGGYWTASNKSITMIRGNAIASALHAYYSDHKKYPVNLDELIPKYVSTIQNPTTGNSRWDYLLYNNGDFFQLKFSANNNKYPCAVLDSANISHWKTDE